MSVTRVSWIFKKFFKKNHLWGHTHYGVYTMYFESDLSISTLRNWNFLNDAYLLLTYFWGGTLQQIYFLGFILGLIISSCVESIIKFETCTFYVAKRSRDSKVLGILWSYDIGWGHFVSFSISNNSFFLYIAKCFDDKIENIYSPVHVSRLLLKSKF